MEKSNSSDFVILGGGIAGLTFALEATRRDRRTVVLESEERIGGLARTLAFGDYRFDLGGHRFHSRWPQVTAWVLDLMGDDLLEVSRYSRILLNGRYVDYPLRFLNALTALSLPQAVHVCASYLGASLRRRSNRQDISFEDWVVRRFGRALYDIYFRPYTEKVWGMVCTELSADWASQRIKVPSLTAAVKASLFRRASPQNAFLSSFVYPPLGIGMIPDRMAEQARATGKAVIHVGSQVRRLEVAGASGEWRVYYRQAGQEKVVAGKQIVSTIPLGALLQTLPLPQEAASALSGALEYRGLICLFLAVDGTRISSDTWTYFPDPQLIFGRTHEPPNWSPQMAPSGKSSLCVEVFCSEGDDVWRRADGELIEAVLTDLDSLGFLTPDRVCGAWLLRVPCAYPVYRVGYTETFQQVRDALTRWPTLHLLGRTGSFQYLNIDGTILQALQLADTLAG
jgi:protoporphyrinogen oxidase